MVDRDAWGVGYYSRMCEDMVESKEIMVDKVASEENPTDMYTSHCQGQGSSIAWT
ncbi:hypothetical protein A2U01_0011052 [Trifolium medium]|uniref:Uncharacterized protein n=1 Tax=Trifolium medium TaxID=97028 RepID=A0A392MS46_9FABA|nr:hypothetical protein [Trifolium medium]